MKKTRDSGGKENGRKRCITNYASYWLKGGSDILERIFPSFMPWLENYLPPKKRQSRVPYLWALHRFFH